MPAAQQQEQHEPPASIWKRVLGLSAAVAVPVIFALLAYWWYSGSRIGTFVPVVSMNEPRMHHTASDLSGNVYQRLFLIAGGEATSPHRTTELYDREARNFSPGPNMLHAHSRHEAIAITSKEAPAWKDVYIVAGTTGAWAVEKFRADTRSFSLVGQLITPRSWSFAAAAYGDRILITGGQTFFGDPVMALAELFNTATGGSIPVSPMHQARAGHTATTLRGSVPGALIFGGAENSAELFHVSNDTFSVRGAPSGRPGFVRRAHTVTDIGGNRLLIVGGIWVSATGTSESCIEIAEIYDSNANSFTRVGSLATARFWHTATAASGGVLIAGGSSCGNPRVLASAELFDLRTNTFGPTGSMSVPRERHAAIDLLDGTVLITGGQNSTGVLASAELYHFTDRPR